MRFYRKHTTITTIAIFVLGLSLPRLARTQAVDRPRTNGYGTGYSITDDTLRKSAQGHYPGSPIGASPFAPAGTNFDRTFETVRRQQEQSATYREIAERQRLRAAQEEAIRSQDEFQWYRESARKSTPTLKLQTNPNCSRTLKTGNSSCATSAPCMWTPGTQDISAMP